MHRVITVSAQRTHLADPVAEFAEDFQQLRMLFGQDKQPSFKRQSSLDQCTIILVLCASDGNIAANLVKDALQGFFIDIVGSQAETITVSDHVATICVA